MAIADYDRVIALKPDYADAYNNRGIVYRVERNPDRAIQDFDQAIKLKPRGATFYVNRGLAYRDKGEHRRSTADYDQAIALQPDFACSTTIVVMRMRCLAMRREPGRTTNGLFSLIRMWKRRTNPPLRFHPLQHGIQPLGQRIERAARLHVRHHLFVDPTARRELAGQRGEAVLLRGGGDVAKALEHGPDIAARVGRRHAVTGQPGRDLFGEGEVGAMVAVAELKAMNCSRWPPRWRCQAG